MREREDVREQWRMLELPMGSNGGTRGFGSSHHPSGNARSTMISPVLLMVSLLACFYIAGRLWEDAETRTYLAKLSQKRKLLLERESLHLSVGEQLKVLNCKHQLKKLAALEMELTAAKSHGFGPRLANATSADHKLHAVVGIMTTFGNRFRRDATRNTWMPKGEALKDLEREQGIVIRFVIGRSANRGDMSDRRLDVERAEHNDFLFLEDHVESDDSLSLKSKSYFSTAVEQWDSEFYVKVDDDIFVNIDKLGTSLAKHRDKPRVYLGCLKSGEVVSDSSSQWYEPEWWKFGNEKSQYYLHASGQIYSLSKALAQYININSASLHAYKNEDISVGSWMLGLDIEHVDDRSFCCVASLPGWLPILLIIHALGMVQFAQQGRSMAKSLYVLNPAHCGLTAEHQSLALSWFNEKSLGGKTIAREPFSFKVLASFSPAGCKVNEYEAPLHGNAVEYCRFF